MNRREAIAALTALPGVAQISVANVKPNDVIVIECDAPISAATAEHIKAVMKGIWPNNACAVLGEGMNLKVVRS